MTGPLIRGELVEGRPSLTVPSTGVRLTGPGLRGWVVRCTVCGRGPSQAEEEWRRMAGGT